MDQTNVGRFARVEARLELVEEDGSGGLHSRDIGPEAVAGDLLFEEAPDPLNQVEGGHVGRAPEGNHPAVPGRPPRAEGGDSW